MYIYFKKKQNEKHENQKKKKKKKGNRLDFFRSDRKNLLNVGSEEVL